MLPQIQQSVGKKICVLKNVWAWKWSLSHNFHGMLRLSPNEKLIVLSTLTFCNEI